MRESKSTLSAWLLACLDLSRSRRSIRRSIVLLSLQISDSVHFETGRLRQLHTARFIVFWHWNGEISGRDAHGTGEKSRIRCYSTRFRRRTDLKPSRARNLFSQARNAASRGPRRSAGPEKKRMKCKPGLEPSLWRLGSVRTRGSFSLSSHRPSDRRREKNT